MSLVICYRLSSVDQKEEHMLYHPMFTFNSIILFFLVYFIQPKSDILKCCCFLEDDRKVTLKLRVEHWYCRTSISCWSLHPQDLLKGSWQHQSSNVRVAALTLETERTGSGESYWGCFTSLQLSVACNMFTFHWRFITLVKIKLKKPTILSFFLSPWWYCCVPFNSATFKGFRCW